MFSRLSPVATSEDAQARFTMGQCQRQHRETASIRSARLGVKNLSKTFQDPAQIKRHGRSLFWVDES
jgi:hypothetical protein